MEVAGIELNWIGIIAGVAVIFSLIGLIVNRKDRDTSNDLLLVAAIATVIFLIVGINR